MRFFLDTEFTNLPWTGRSELLWVALTDETGHREFSVVNSDCSLTQVSPFARTHVLPKLDGAPRRLPRVQLAEAVADFVGHAPQFWAWFPSLADITWLAGDGNAALLHRQFADWDFRLLCDLFTTVPPDWPSACHDVHALAIAADITLPHNDNPHDPLADARWCRAAWLRARQRQ